MFWHAITKVNLLFLTALLTGAVITSAIYFPSEASAQGIKITRSGSASDGKSNAPKLEMPVDCELGENCWIVNYVDVDPSEDIRADFTCNPRTYEGHKGTDFGLADRRTMEAGINVLSATSGTVSRVRNNVPDRPALKGMPYDVEEGKECGNGILVDLPQKGWKIAYCHMKESSITVKPGDKIKAGDKIGLIGQSGNADFPHLHISIYHDNITIDPFTGQTDTKGCNQEAHTLWKDTEAVSYSPVDIYAAGFENAQPVFDQIKIDASAKEFIAVDSDIITLWASFYGVKKDDIIEMEILTPRGESYAARQFVMSKDRAQQFYFIGRKTRSAPLMIGVYTGDIKLSREINGKTETFSRRVYITAQ